MIKVRQKGNFSRVTRYLQKTSNAPRVIDFDKYGRAGVSALASATPVETGLTASSWYYKIERSGDRVTINFANSNVQNGVPIAIILQYGHGTRSGGWVEGRDYINPAIQPIFDKITDSAWEEVTRV